MCGICGKLQFDREQPVSPESITRMMEMIVHRGPDARGHYVSGPIGLGHTRLAIIDLNTGAQPLSNEDKTIWLVYNGEIYNFQELREYLLKKGHKFRTASDTEVIVHLYEEYGVGCLSHLRGMFAFALWDETQRTLLLARDRVGIKPLYYINTGKALIFGSEIKALIADPDVKCQVDPQSIDKFLTHLCLPGRDTLWKGIQKLEPGFYLVASGTSLKVHRYWDLEISSDNRWKSIGHASEALLDLVKKTVREHMISDVPVGFLLSGGVDSTVALSCAAAETSKRIRTFTVGFEDAGFVDERPYAKIAAKWFGTEHHEISITPKEFWDFLPSLVWHMEEPVYDPPAVSLHYVSKLARSHVKVLLSGEGGDECFGGYHTYRNFLFLESVKARIRPLQGILAKVLNGVGHIPQFAKIAQFAPYATTALSDYYYSRAASPFCYFNKNKKQLYTCDFYDRVSQDKSTEIIQSLFSRVQGQPLLNQMQYIDIKTSLSDDLLIKADKMTMGNSLELRVPFLDHLMLEFGASLPPKYKVKSFTTKRILKETFRNRIPTEIIERKKAGFPIPVEKWITETFRDQVSDILLGNRFLNRGYFNKGGVEKLLLMGKQGRPVAAEIFSLLTLELLLVQFADR